MTVNAITDTKKGRTGIAPTYLHTTQSSFVVTAFGGGEEWPVLYNITGSGLAQLLYNVTWGREVLKKWHFLLYNMWTAPSET